MRTSTPGAPPALVRALGVDPVQLTIGGQVQPAGRYGAITMRRARGTRDPIGSPATCALDVVVDTVPSWRQGDPLAVELTPAVLDQLYGPQQPVRTNLLTNPSMETANGAGSATGWTAVNAAQLILDTTVALVGTHSLELVTAAAADSGVACAPFPVTVGASYAARAAVRPTTAGLRLRVVLQWLNASQGQVGVPAEAWFTPPAGQWTTVATPTAVAPTGATQARVQVVRDSDTTAGQRWHLDAALARRVDAGDTFNPDWYWDGDTTDEVDGYRYAWSGTPYSSTSTATDLRRDQARTRFAGRITDLTLDATRTSCVAHIIATGTLAALGRTDIGAEPWPAEYATQRVSRVLALAAAKDPTIRYVNAATVDQAPVGPQDVDRQTAQQLLEDLSVTVGPRAGVFERRSGELWWLDGYRTDQLPPLDLSAEAVQLPLSFTQPLRINQATVKAAGRPKVGQVLHTNLVTNPSFEVSLLGWGSDAASVGNRDTAQKYVGASSMRVVLGTQATAGVFTRIFDATPGRRYQGFARARSDRATTLALSVVFQAVDQATVVGRADFPVTLAANTWTDLTAQAVAPPGTIFVRLYITRPAAGVTGHQIWVDTVKLSDDPSDPLGYFDGASTATPQHSFAWASTVGLSESYAKAGAEPLELAATTWLDQDQADAGVQAVTVDTLLDATLEGTIGNLLRARADAELISPTWAPADVTVDLLQLLDGRIESVSAHPTPAAEAAAALRAELGSARTIATSGTEPAFMPDLDLVDVVTGLTEVITPHRWTLTTTAERTL